MSTTPYHGPPESFEARPVDLLLGVLVGAVLSVLVVALFGFALLRAAAEILWERHRAALYGFAAAVAYAFTCVAVHWRAWEERRTAAEAAYGCRTDGCFESLSRADALAHWATLGALALAAGLLAALAYKYFAPEPEQRKEEP